MTPQLRELRVQPVPSAHPYPQSLRRRGPSPGAAVVHLPDPPVSGAPDGVWWPPPALQPRWVEQYADDVDVVHLHFGFDGSSPAELTAWCDALEMHAIPLVLTVHDLVNPHFGDQGEHVERLAVLITRAHTLVALTRAAAQQIRDRWGRRATVITHPHVAPLDLVGIEPHRPRTPFVVGMHLKSLRANVIAMPVVDAVVAVLPRLPGALLRVHLHREVVDPAHPRHDAALLAHLRSLDADGWLELVVHEPHTDDELWRYLRSLHLSVLPYAFGTHSGWLEACHDLGTPALAPRTGLWTDQQRTFAFDWAPGGLPDARQIAAAVTEAYTQRPLWQASRVGRERQQQEVASIHEVLYRAAAADVASTRHSERRAVPAGILA